ncbi:sigma-54-dependent transcriptional regulator [Myxococcus virescens]|uniref:DNA-binding transcriptional response regulator, NtrC family, contains REC, AAA-type ATPase, and a Fis-type DNA-binding domains n=1 Tax=Myxococcus virescens TaxID=83456 RepID=A0A511H6S9_9BACT|nr:sigma-54 dependent transcriptional regulator [Myxococcus virescens]GEL69231.1 sigma-54-dependent Fis family transcriptional regulator [Myxococcus virescens]SDD32755.1 DNA-binding transcriptional response regulator, NtrC family, contains REC, AAA-type ATPase, and a Fis-type DNA-binding domains [Myxococcus virescens]
MKPGPRILIVDDDSGVLRALRGLLSDEGFTPVEARSAAEASQLLDAPEGPPAMMLLDLRMPGETGLELLARLPRPFPAPVVVLSGEASPAEAVQALRLGATDFVEKPPSPERLLTAVRNALALGSLQEERERLLDALARPGHLVGDSPGMVSLRQLIARVGPSDTAILITGETGTGKERVARALHLASGRKGRLVAVNCAAIPSTLLESELFGHEKGAFSGALSRRAGRIEQAHGGTLFLDELGDMPLELQAKLLRVLETKEVERLGGSLPVPVDARVVAATHQDLARAVKEGRFRQDLYFRLNVMPLQVPPLRERPEDLLPLARAFAAEFAGPQVPLVLAPGAETSLRAYAWPGNVRELRNLIERLNLLRGEGPLTLGPELVSAPQATAAASRPSLGQKNYREHVEDFERELIRAALQEGESIAGAARLLQVDRGNLYRRIKALGLPVT